MKLFYFQIPIGASLSLFTGTLAASELVIHPEVCSRWLYWAIAFGLSFLLLASGITNMIAHKDKNTASQSKEK